jgi:hypothetical protein
MNSIGLYLTDEQLNQIESLATINSDIKAIAFFLKLEPDILEEEFLNDGSALRKAIEKGEAKALAKIDQKVFSDAQAGDKDSIKSWKSDAARLKYERYKSKITFDKEVSSYEALQAAIEHGVTGKLPENLQKYYEIIDFIRTLYNKFNSRTYIINSVRLRWKEVSYSLANKLYYESLNFFNLDNEVKKEVWANVYADKLDNIALLALERGDLEVAGKYVVDAAKMRGVGKENAQQIPAELLNRRPILYTTKIADLGVSPVNRKMLGDLIDNLDVPEQDRNRLKRDAMIEDVQFEVAENDKE